MNDDDGVFERLCKLLAASHAPGPLYDLENMFYSKKQVDMHLDLPPDETDEEKVVRLIKGDFEEMHGISFSKFQRIYKEILKNNPEKFI